MSKKAIQILKSKMTLKERKLFVENCKEQGGLIMQDKMDNRYANNLKSLFCLKNSFAWSNTKDGYKYWVSIYDRFTFEEFQTTIDFNELKSK
jgi:hypothetical protein